MNVTRLTCAAAVTAVLAGGAVLGAQGQDPQIAGGGTGSLTAGEKVRIEAAQMPRMASGVRVPMESKIVKGAPYSAEVVIENVQLLADGNRIVTKTTGRVYRDSQGRTRREEDRAPGQVASISVSDPVARTSISMDPETRTAWKTAASTAGVLMSKVPMTGTLDPAELERRRALEAEMAAAQGSVRVRAAGGGGAVARGGGGGGGLGGAIRRVPAPWDEKTDKLPARNIEGVMAEGTRITRTIPAGAIGNEQPIVTTTEEWISGDLQILVLTKSTDPRSGDHTYRLLNITRAEPNASWFEIPADYTVRESGVGRVSPDAGRQH